MMRYVIFAATLLLVATPAVAQFQVPGECTELAAREGFPTDVLNKSQAAQARVRMARLSDRDPLVRQCRGAIRHAQAMMKEMEKSAAASPSSTHPAP
jgi:Flp pilus assembly protein TadD